MSVEVANESGIDVDVDAVMRQARFVLDRLRIHPLAELSVLFVDEPAMAALHEEWIDEPGPTDVMAFPMDELRVTPADAEPEPGLLGDVVICPQVARRQAEEARHAFDDEVALLLTHGILHLLGHDHGEPEEHREMFALQALLLAEWEAARSGPGGEAR